MKATTIRPGHVGVQRLARQRVPEGSPAGGGLRDELAPQELGQPCRAGRARHDGKVELLPGDRGDLGRRPARGREVRYADEHGIADGVGHRHLAAAGELQPAPARHDGIGERQRLRELLDEEGDARVRSWIARTSDGAGGCSNRCVSSSAVSGGLSGGTVTSVRRPVRRSSCLTRRRG